MTRNCRIAIVHPGDAAGTDASGQGMRYLPVCRALEQSGAQAQLVAYHDTCVDQVKARLLHADGVLVWVNPIEDGRDRSILDAMLGQVAAAGVFVSAHPEVVLTLGTKEVLYRTRHMGWGCDIHQYLSAEQMHAEFPGRLMGGEARVLKQYRGNGGDGVWKVQRSPSDGGLVEAWHAKRGCVQETLPLDDFMARIASYFHGQGRIIDQAYQPRLPEGMVRCYLVHGKVAGFGRQAITALCPPPEGASFDAAPPPSPRYYHPPSMPEFQSLKRHLEEDWIPELQQLLAIPCEALPVIWDCDFLFGPKSSAGEDTYVLGEINVSSVSPFPDSALPELARAAIAQAQKRMR